MNYFRLVSGAKQGFGVLGSICAWSAGDVGAVFCWEATSRRELYRPRGRVGWAVPVKPRCTFVLEAFVNSVAKKKQHCIKICVMDFVNVL